MSAARVNSQISQWQKSIDWESPACNFCGNHENPFYQETKDKRFHGRTLRLVKCPDCGLIYADPRPTTQSYIDVYKTLWAEDTRKYKFDRRGVLGWHSKMINEALEYHPNAKSLFDVGTGAGTIMIAGRKLGIRVAGNDLNKPACDWLKKRGYTIYNTPTIDLKIKTHFDIQFCNDYIEHTNTPYDDLKWIYNHTRRGGIMSLKTMYLDSEEYTKNKEKWHMLSGFHTHYFYQDVLKRMIEAVGFKIINVRLNVEIIHIIARKE